MHILAISGLHVGFFYLLLKALFNLLRMPSRLSCAAGLPLTLLYALLTGASLPVMRASVMVMALLAAPFLGRERDGLNALGLAAVVLLASNPLQLMETGFQLSFSAVLSILLLAGGIASRLFRLFPCGPAPGQKIVERREIALWFLGKKVITLLSSSLAAWLGILSFAARQFHIVTLLGPVCNMVVIPAGFAIVGLGFAGAVISLCSPSAAGVLNHLNGWIVTCMLAAVRGISAIRWSWFQVDVSGWFRQALLCGIVLISAWLILPGGPKWKLRAGLLLIAALALPTVIFSQGPRMLEITFLDVGQGDAAYVEFPWGENLLIDGGPASGAAALKAFLQARGCKSVDAVLLTHPHDDHLLGLFDVLENFTVGRLILPTRSECPRQYERFLRLAAAKGVPCFPVSGGDTVAGNDKIRIDVLNPGALPLRGGDAGGNNASIAIMLTYGRVRFLFCADMEREAEENLCREAAALRADLMKVGHHGGKRSSTAPFLDEIGPRWAIVSAGEGNRFGHPAPQSLARLKVAGAQILRTDLHGAVCAATDGEEIKVSAARID